MDAQHIVVVSGHPSEVELAALTAALDRRPTVDDTPAPAPASRWTRAARLEARGHPAIDSPTSLAWQEAPDGSR